MTYGTCTLIVEEGSCRLEAPYCKEFVQALKDLLPPDRRTYHENSQTWEFPAEYLDEVEELAGIFYRRVLLK